MKPQELRDLSTEELHLKRQELQAELFQLVNEFKLTKKTEKGHRIPLLKKDIARTFTVLRERIQPSTAAL